MLRDYFILATGAVLGGALVNAGAPLSALVMTLLFVAAVTLVWK